MRAFKIIQLIIKGKLIVVYEYNSSVITFTKEQYLFY